MGTKRALDNWTMPKLQESFTTVAIVCRRCERSESQFCKMFSRSFSQTALSKWRRLKPFHRNCVQVR